MKRRIRLNPDGSIKLPQEVLDELKWLTGSYLEFEVQDEGVRIWRVEVDVFAEAIRKPDPDSFEKILKDQKEITRQAAEEFEKKIKNPPKIRPEDRPEFWD